MSKHILSLDQGTTSSRAVLFDRDGNIHGIAQREFRQIFPSDGWVEHDAEEIWQSQKKVVAEVLEKCSLKSEHISAIGITNQRETTVVWDRNTGKPVCNAIVWQDRRTSAYCDALKAKGLEHEVREKTGLVIDAYFSGTKLNWILQNIPGVRERATKGELCFGTIDSWLVYKLTEGKVHVTDVSNASRTMLFNINTLQWDDDLLKEMNIPAVMLPKVKSSSEVYGQCILFGNSPIPISGIAGDQQAALFGQMCTKPGMVKNTYGTGCFMLMNTGIKKITSHHSLITTIAWQVNGEVHYALEGSVFIAGAVVQWLRDGLKLIETSSDVEKLAKSVDDNGGVTIVPAFSGLGAPYWDQYARGSIFGITRATTEAHIARAAVESIALQTNDVLKAMEADAGIKIDQLRVDGGASLNSDLMQFQSDILNAKVVRPEVTETTALGAAYLAGLAVGYWKNIDEIMQQWKENAVFVPSMEETKKQKLLDQWKRAIKATIHWSANT